MKFAALLLAALLGAACSGQPEVVEPRDGGTGGPEARIFVTDHGWHTGIVVPAAAINRDLPFLRRRFGDVPYYEFGWGDRGFYQARKTTLGLTAQAILWPSETVLHVAAVPLPPQAYFSNSAVVAISITAAGMESLRQFIANSFYRDGDAKTVSLQAGLYGDAQFYKAVGEYSLLNTSNNWTAKALKSAGIDISPGFTPTAASVIDAVRNR